MDTVTHPLLLPLSCTLFLFLFLFVVLLLIKLSLSSSSHGNPTPPPSPPALPFIGHIHLIKGSLYLFLTSLTSRYGPVFSLRFGCRSFVIVSSPSAIEECFTRNDVVLANRPKSMAADRLTYNYASIATSPYGHYWRVVRRLIVVEMLSSQRLHKSAGQREEEIGVILRGLRDICRNEPHRAVDLNYFISAFTFNVMMRNVAGKRWVEEKDVSGEIGKENMRRIRGILFSGLELNLCDFFPVLRWIGYKGIEKNMVLIKQKRDEFLQALIAETESKPKSGTLIETLLSLQASEPEFYTNDVIKSILLVMFLAGTETSAATIEWAMKLLLSHPDKLLKLVEEIDANVGHDRLIRDSDLANLPYLRCVVNETLRLYPPVPLLLPHCSSEQCTISGYTIAKDTIVLVNAWGMHRDPGVWEEADEFKPERFLGVEVDKEGHKFMAFGMGRRACPGSGMGVRTVSLALGAFVQCFEWEGMMEDEDVGVDMESNYRARITLQKSKPLEAVCRLRHRLIFNSPGLNCVL